MGTEVLIKGRVSRDLPQKDTTGSREGAAIRINDYDEVFVMTPVRKSHLLANEGAYFTTNNAQSGIASPAVTAFGATTPIAVVSNNDTPGGKRMFLDYMAWITTAAGSFASAGVNLQLVVVTDAGDRYTSGGTDLSNNIVNPNQDGPVKSGIAKVRFGAITAAAATGAARVQVGLRIIRPVVSATVADVVGETKLFNFGAVEGMLNGSITVANANNIPMPLPPIIIGPQQCALFYFLMNGTTPAAASYAPEFAWWER